MNVFLLTVVLWNGSGGISVNTQILGDKQSCIRAGYAFQKISEPIGNPVWSCTEVKKP